MNLYVAVKEELNMSYYEFTTESLDAPELPSVGKGSINEQDN